MDKATKAAKALVALLDELYRLVAAIVMGVLYLVGIAPRPTAATVARDVLEQAPAAPEPEPEIETPDLGWLIKDHASRRLGRRPAGMPTLAPLPAVVESWIAELDPAQIRRLASHDLAARLIQQHVTSGTAGCLPTLGYVLPPMRKAYPAPVAPGREGRTGKGSMRVDLQEVLEDLGYAPAGPRFR